MGTKNKYETDEGGKERKKMKVEWQLDDPPSPPREKKKKKKSKVKEMDEEENFAYVTERSKKESKRKSEVPEFESSKREKVTIPKFHDSDDDDEEDEDEEAPPTSSKREHRKSSASEADEPAPSPSKDGKTNEGFFYGWTKNDVFELLNRIQAAIPKNDTLRYKSRTEKLEWEKVKFGNYTAEECKAEWKSIENRIRGYRVLSEVLADAKEWVETPWTHFYRSGKRNRHPDLPKRPLSSYMIFYLEKKDKYSKKHAGLGMTALSKLIGEKYKALPPHKKAKYEKLSSAKRVEYQEQMKHFIQEHPAEALKLASHSVPKKVEPGMPGPKKPVTPFKLYLQDKIKHYKDDPGFKLADFTNECKLKWKNMTEKKKYPWINWAHEAETKYLEELKVYLEENPNVTIPSHKSVLSKEEKVILDRMSGKPDKPPNSAYSLFSRNMLKNTDLSALTPKERLQEIARLWKEIPQTEKELYTEEVKRLTDNYKMEYATYLDSLPDDRREEELASTQGRGRKGKVEKAAGTKMKQATLVDAFKKGSTKSANKEDEAPSLEFLSQEPKAPPQTTYAFFAESFVKKGKGDEQKAKVVWQAMSQKAKEIYEVKLDTLKQQYYIKYREFLTSLSADQLKIYSEVKGNNAPEKENDENEAEEDEGGSSSDSDSSSSDSSSDSEAKPKHTFTDTKVEKPSKQENTDESSSDSDSSDSDED